MSLVEMAVDPEARLVATPVVEPVVEPVVVIRAVATPVADQVVRVAPVVLAVLVVLEAQVVPAVPEGPVVRAVRSERAGHRNQEATVASTPLPNVRKH